MGYIAVKNCLVVDDSRVIRKVACRILETLHFQAAEAEDGEAALEACRQSMPDVVLIDAQMPNMSGVEFVRALRREQGGYRPRIVYCTTEHDMAQINEALNAGANEYLMKPYDRESVEAKFAEAGIA
ncbi:MAG TPA: response regulator [Rhizomicrobium sp.]|nr:response regulator [Rhizomicrobium sp.]